MSLEVSAPATGDELLTPCGDPRNYGSYKFDSKTIFKCSLKGCLMSCPDGKKAQFSKKFSKASCKSKKGKSKWSPKKGKFSCV